ncbi:MAG: ABC transporter ATP-binding protein [Actinomycetota bacterium]
MSAVAFADQVVKRFGEVAAVDNMTLEVRRGEVVGLLGANGAGKTTFIRVLLGLLRPTSGEVRLFGSPPSRSVLRRVGYVPQSLGLYTDLTISQNLAFRAGLYRVAPLPLPAKLNELANVPVGRLPLGIQRQAAFAAALAHGPDLLVLDEPSSGVGPLGRARLWETIRSTAEDGAGVLVTTHHLEEAEQCDRLVMMAGGRQVAAGTIDEVIGDRSAVEISTTEWQRGFVALEKAGWPVRLSGRRLRVAGVASGHIKKVLAVAGIDAFVEERPSTLDEVFVSLSRA